MGWFSELVGSGGAKRARQATAAAQGYLNEGEAGALGDYETAEGYFDPFAATGTASNKFWADLMGLNGAEARQAAQATYTSDPIYQAMGDKALKGISRGVAASGQTGAGIQAGTNALTANYTEYLNKLLAGSGQGMQAAGAQAGIRKSAGDLRFGAGQQRGVIAQQGATAQNQARQGGINNLLGIAGLGVQAYTGAMLPRGRA